MWGLRTHYLSPRYNKWFYPRIFSKIKIMEGTLDLSAFQNSQSGPISLHLGWIGCANLLANPEQHQSFRFFNFPKWKTFIDLNPHILSLIFCPSNVKSVYHVILRTKIEELSHKNMVAHLGVCVKCIVGKVRAK